MANARNMRCAGAFVVAMGALTALASGLRGAESPCRDGTGACRREMVWIPGGAFRMGSTSRALPDAQPVHRVKVRGFWLDSTEVTNEQFMRFVQATAYLTLAERPPRPEDSPDVPLRLLEAGSLVFSPPAKPASPENHDLWWRFVAGANWQHPEGPASDLVGRMQEPVVHIAYADALAYADWAHKRLPSEAEWEFAARAGAKGHAAPPARSSSKFAAENFVRPLPVASDRPDDAGLFDMLGNVWEWVRDRYRPDDYAMLAGRASPSRDPAGPPERGDPREPDVNVRVQRGGPFFCDARSCSPYTLEVRGKARENVTTNHTGFRCARDAER